MKVSERERETERETQRDRDNIVERVSTLLGNGQSLAQAEDPKVGKWMKVKAAP